MANTLTRKRIVIVLLCALIFVAGVLVWHRLRLVVPPRPDNGQVKKEQSVDESVSEAVKTYADATQGFSFDYPDNFKLKASVEGDQNSIAINGEDGKNGLQILIGAYDEKDALSFAVIKNDAGELSVAYQKEITVGQKNPVQAFSFTLKNPDADPGDVSADLAEIWFVRNGNLYQLSNYKDFDPYIGKILQSFKFE